MLAPTIMVQGTASSVGKSLLVTALCRFFQRAGVHVAPFKSQNMSLNSAATSGGHEIGRAQAVQAQAAGLECSVEMNPILLKPEGDRRSQVVVMGKSIGSMSAREYHAHKPKLKHIIEECLETLRRRYELVLIEGAGSPAEINLKAHDIVNMYVARVAAAPVLLVGDIDRGGVFASFVGTLDLLEQDERDRIAAFVINKFRGDLALLRPGLDFLTRRTDKPVLGVVPFIPALRIADEDSLSLENRRSPDRRNTDKFDIVVIRLPWISNYDDVLALEHEPNATVRFVDEVAGAEGADLVIVPGSKSTIADLEWLRRTGLARLIERRAALGQLVLGVCGGCQMLGETIEDPEHVESEVSRIAGLGLLPLSTRFEREKITAQVLARPSRPCFLNVDSESNEELVGYEIHAGVVHVSLAAASPFQIVSRNGQKTNVMDGACNASGSIVGTMIHGIFENASVRRSLLNSLGRDKNLQPPAGRGPERWSPELEYDRLADSVGNAIDRELLWRISGL